MNNNNNSWEHALIIAGKCVNDVLKMFTRAFSKNLWISASGKGAAPEVTTFKCFK